MDTGHSFQPRTPTVSVVIPAYNTAKYIAETLDSVFAQTFTDYEVIVINDGSPDTEELEAVLQPYCDRIVYLKQENRGPSAARNLGIRHARGEFVAFLDSDDCWLPEYLASQMKLLQETAALDLVYSDALLFGDAPLNRKTFIQASSPPVTFEGLLTEGNQILPSAAVARRRTIIEAGLFDEGVHRGEDYDVWLRVAYREGKFAFQPKVLVRRRIHPVALTADKTKTLADSTQVLAKLETTLRLTAERRLLLRDQLAPIQAEFELRQGKAHLFAGNFDDAADILQRANAFFRRRKLRLVLLGLQFAPRLTLLGARIWRLLLD